MKYCLALNWRVSIAGFCLIVIIAAIEPKNATYSGLILESSVVLPASSGVKSVLFNSKGTKLYAMNLEGMSVYEYSQADKVVLRKINFKPTEALGWDYTANKTISSFAEKPVEACFSHNDKILWVSLHNGGGIVPIMIDSLNKPVSMGISQQTKTAYITNINSERKDTFHLSLVKTGKTPKVIAKTIDDNYLMVSNWASRTMSVLAINDSVPPYGKSIATIRLPAIPRGIAVDDKAKKTYVAIMGAGEVTVVNNKNWRIEKNMAVPINPRDILMDTLGHLFVSCNSVAQVACIEAHSGKILFKTKTHSQPRSIALSKNQKFLFVTCYGGNVIDVFKINKYSFKRIYSLKCAGKPIGIDLYENEFKLEAWVCNYIGGNLRIYTFQKVY